MSLKSPRIIKSNSLIALTHWVSVILTHFRLNFYNIKDWSIPIKVQLKLVLIPFLNVYVNT